MIKRTLALSVLAAIALFALPACATLTRYDVVEAHSASRRGQVDEQWFFRQVTSDGRLTAVELVYCPLQGTSPAVCRSAIVYQDQQSPYFQSR